MNEEEYRHNYNKQMKQFMLAKKTYLQACEALQAAKSLHAACNSLSATQMKDDDVFQLLLETRRCAVHAIPLLQQSVDKSKKLLVDFLKANDMEYMLEVMDLPELMEEQQ